MSRDTRLHARLALGWRSHARIGIPVTLVTLAIAGGYLALRASLQ